MSDIDKTTSEESDSTPAVWDPFAELEALTQRLAQRRSPWATPWTAFEGIDFTPLADIEESDTAWTIEVELAGVRKKDIEIETHGRTVVITGERKEKARDGVVRQRRRVTGSFRYEVALPGAFDADRIEAVLDNGELTVTVPKQANERPRKVKIT